MNEREFFTEALLSSHSVLMAELMPVALPDGDEELNGTVVPVAEKAARIAALYATQLTLRWRTCMKLSEMAPSSTQDLTNPAPDVPPSIN